MLFDGRGGAPGLVTKQQMNTPTPTTRTTAPATAPMITPRFESLLGAGVVGGGLVDGGLAEDVAGLEVVVVTGRWVVPGWLLRDVVGVRVVVGAGVWVACIVV